ncbi:aminotransferase class V-fold PLP-dependent enzyme [Hyphobacterium sp. HN65]|uniref:Aminotransferase class V-fold PLP-dependent enzyme n=1 Tax=Hyphobacterium lacteum TaxID=3116575 RepID=A0ABU7LQP8_9PROT|nr:aminotransferase class V-fold PLP-dependent enzyme [Hyphobacterium sp. HN65]MEE2525961.1 aminotransferase class V-fold PLP-dependent enzyme [Hyphobacterium sp. HN65]
MDFEDFRAHAHRFSDWMTDYLETVEDRPVRSQSRPGDLLAQLPASPPDAGEDMSAIFNDFEQKVMPGITHWQHPNFFAYFNGNSSPPSVLAEMLTATLAAQCMLWETSPAANELETRMMEWLREMSGLPENWAGTIQDSASTANLCALIAGLERATEGRVARKGLAGETTPIVYASSEAHSSVEKAARIAGIGSDNVRKMPTDGAFAMDVTALEAAIREDREAGRMPACVIACLGATGLGSVDPIRAIGEVCRRENIFFHIDAAWAGSAMILPEERHWMDGIELADSYVFNPHKWLFTNFDCSAFFMRDPSELISALAISPAYLQSPDGEQMPEYRDWTVSLGRRFRALKLWFVIRSYGADRLRGMVRAHIDMAKWLETEISATPDFEIMAPRRFGLNVFRYNPGGLDDAALDALNTRLVQAMNDSGRLYLTKTLLDGRVVIRFVIGQTYTQQHHVESGWAAIREIAAELA